MSGAGAGSPGRDLLRQARDLVAECDRCGTCLPVCPLFRVLDLERASSRGRNTIARGLAEGFLEPGAGPRAAVEFCLLCRACTDTCPNRVPTDQAMIRLRQFFTDAAGGPRTRHRLMGGFLRRRGWVRAGARILAAFRRLGLDALLPVSAAPREATRRQYLAALAGPAVLGGAPPAASFRPGARVAYFQGCGMRLLFPDAARCTLDLLGRSGPVAALDNACCGLPHLAHGMGAEFLRLARENIALAGNADLVVTDCASCGGTLKHLGEHFRDDPDWREPAAAFSAKVMDLSEYLVQAGYRPAPRPGVTFTFHDPCHLARGQGVRAQPRELLRAAGTLVEMDESDACCGGAGTFHLDHPGAAAMVLARKRESIERTGAGIVVTACPGCLVQLTRAAEASQGKFKVLHLSQVL
ncbi:MAG: (Fe-S)-binding protein [Holophaga sp.]